MDMDINSQEYWEQRFVEDWRLNGGPAQTDFFVKLFAHYCPYWLRDYLLSGKYSICDVGCAEGQAVDFLRRNFRLARVAGIDFSERAVAAARTLFFECEFSVANLTSDDLGPYDITYCSNVLEHFSHWLKALSALLRATTHICVILVPFRERDRIDEHETGFNYGSLPFIYEDAWLAYAVVVPSGSLPNSQWAGEQLIAAYVKNGIEISADLSGPGSVADILCRQQFSLARRARENLIDYAGGNGLTFDSLHRHIADVIIEMQDFGRNPGLMDLNEASEQYRRSKEVHIAGLQQQVERLSAELDLSRQENAELKSENARQRERDEKQITELNTEVAYVRASVDAERRERESLQAEYDWYRKDKEVYIAALRAGLDRVRLLLKIPAAIGRARQRLGMAILSTLGCVVPSRLRVLRQRILTDTMTLKPASRAVIYRPAKHGDFGQMLRSTREIDPDAGRVSLIATVLNEAGNIRMWLESIQEQTHRPDEIVIVDGGSKDDTLAHIEEFRRTSHLPTKVISAPGVNIAMGRNLAVRATSFEIIACTDAGCLLHAGWLENMVAPFLADPRTEVVAGWTEGLVDGAIADSLERLFVPRRGNVDLDHYLPSSRTIAFTKSAWAAVRGYPEWLMFAAEDTYFAMMLRNCCRRWVVAPEATTYWRMRPSLRSMCRQAYSYGFGDGEAAINASHYATDRQLLLVSGCQAFAALLAIAAAILLPVSARPLTRWSTVAAVVVTLGAIAAVKIRRLGRIYAGEKPRAFFRDALTTFLFYVIVASRNLGHIHGVRRRPEADRKRFAGLAGWCVMFSGVPIDDSGGGQRAAQITLELLSQSFRVVFLNQYPRDESVDLGIRFAHPNLETCDVRDFDCDAFLGTVRPGQNVFAIAEFPHPAFLPVLLRLQALGVKIVYDLIDDWRSSLGGDWYSIQTEKRYVEIADSCTASAHSLVQRLGKMGAQRVTYVPNAVNRRLFVAGEYPRPTDFPKGEYVVTYVGSLWGSWFDWEILLAVARRHRRATVIVIGDYRGQCPRQLPNLYFLGLRRQSQLPAYLAHSHVGIIPFKVSELSQAVSPLKAFEYLAMGLPVVATPLKELEGLPYVSFADSPEDFADAVESARAMDLDPQVLECFIEEHSWSVRVLQIVGSLSGCEVTSGVGP
jgi:glycosyltransferase involved in cell wall biosynthesis